MAIVGAYRRRVVSGQPRRALMAGGYNGFGDMSRCAGMSDATARSLCYVEEAAALARTAASTAEDVSGSIASVYNQWNPDSDIGAPEPETPARTPVRIDAAALETWQRYHGRLQVKTPTRTRTGTGTGSASPGAWLQENVDLPVVGPVPRWQAGLGIAAVATGIGLIVKSFL